MKQNKFINHLGEKPTIKVLEFLIDGRNCDFNMTDIIQASKVGSDQAYKVIKKLIKHNMVKKLGK